MKKSFVRAGIVLVFALMSCHSEVVTGPFPQYFYLSEVRNFQPPYLISESSSQRTYLLSEDLTFTSADEVQRTTVLQTENLATGATTTNTSRATLEYRRDGENIEIGTFHCPINALCAPNDVGVITSASIVLTARRFGSERTLIFSFRGSD